MAALWLSAVFAVSSGSDMEVFTVVLGTLLLSVPMCLTGICTSTLYRKRSLSALFRKQGWLYNLLSGLWLRIVIKTIAGLTMSFLLLVQLHVYEQAEWVVLAATIPLFAIVFPYIQRRLLKAGLYADMAVTGAAWICPAMLLGIQVAAMLWWVDVPQHASIEAAIAAHTPEAADRSGNALVKEVLHWVAYFDGLKARVLGQFGSTDTPAWLLMGLLLGDYVLFYFFCRALSCFRIPRTEFVRAGLAPRSSEDDFKVAAVATLLLVPLVYVLLQGGASVVNWLELERIRTDVVTDTASVERLVLEQIDGEYRRQGTHEQLRKARSEAAVPVGAAAEQVRREVDAVFRRLEDEAVDEYLDWYYSLAGEWGRLATLVAGFTEDLEDHLVEKLLETIKAGEWDQIATLMTEGMGQHLEDHLAEKLRETFGQEKWYAGIDAAFARLRSADEEARTAYEQTARDILDRNRVDLRRLQYAEVDVVLIASLDDILEPPFHQDFIPAAHRWLGSGAVGSGVASIIARKVTAKVFSKLALKAAATAPLKALASKAASGAVAGSILPGAGTAIGAILGALLGIGSGIAVDGALLKTEEALRRDDFRREIVTVVRVARREFVDRHLGTPNPPKLASPGDASRQHACRTRASFHCAHASWDVVQTPRVGRIAEGGS